MTTITTVAYAAAGFLAAHLAWASVEFLTHHRKDRP